MRSLYITVKDIKGRTHNYREVPSRLVLETGETVDSVREGSWRVSDMLSDETLIKMHTFKRALSGVATRA